MYWRRKNKRYRERRRKERRREMSSYFLQPHPPHTHTHTKKETIFISCFPQIPFCNPPKNPPSSSLHCLKRTMFFPNLCGLFGLCLGQSFHRENTSLSFIFLSLPFLPLVFLALLLFLSLSQVSSYPLYISLYLKFIGILCFLV